MRNPLGVIETATFNVRRKRKNADIDRHLDTIEKKVAEAAQIISNLLLYARIKMPEKNTFNFINLIEESIAIVKRQFAKYAVTITIEKKTARRQILGDPVQLREVICNIIANAFQSFPEKKGSLRIIIAEDAGMLTCSFRDSGGGVDGQTLAHVFEPFFTTKSKGTGLGLSISHELIKLHGGTISITSTKGTGTCVTIRLPEEEIPSDATLVH